MHISHGFVWVGRFLAMMMVIGTLLKAYDLPALRNANSITVMFKPQRVGEIVEFSFEKQDMNGYTGADSCVFSIFAPSGKLVWEETCPDDGDVGTEWKEGPRQLLVASFVPEEDGIYLMKANTASGDFHLCFDNTKVKNAAWGFSGSSFRFSTGDKLSCYLFLPPKKLGETQGLKMELCIYKNSINQNIGVDADGVTVLENVTLPHRDPVTYHQLVLNRLPREDVYHLHADKFIDIVSMKFPGYGSYMFFLEEPFARAFAEEKPLEGTLLTLESQVSHAPMAFGRQSSFLVTFLPAKADEPFDFATRVFGKDVRFTNGNASAFLDVPVDSIYHGVDLSVAPAGRLEFNLASRGFAHPLSPEKGMLVDLNTMLVWSAVKEAVGYKVELDNCNTGETLSVNAKQNRLMLQGLGDKLTPGVWRWAVVTSDGKRGEESFMLVPQQKFTRLAYCHAFSPAMDSIQEKAPVTLQCCIDLLSADDIDFVRSHALINTKERVPLHAVSSSAIGCAGDAANLPGRNQVTFIVYDRSGTRTEASWGFFIGTAPEAPTFDSDAQGNVLCNGTPFFPMI